MLLVHKTTHDFINIAMRYIYFLKHFSCFIQPDYRKISNILRVNQTLITFFIKINQENINIPIIECHYNIECPSLNPIIEYNIEYRYSHYMTGYPIIECNIFPIGLSTIQPNRHFLFCEGASRGHSPIPAPPTHPPIPLCGQPNPQAHFGMLKYTKLGQNRTNIWK